VKRKTAIVSAFVLLFLLLSGLLLWSCLQAWEFEQRRLTGEVEALVKETAGDIQNHNGSLVNNYALMLTDKEFGEKIAFAAGATLNRSKLRVHFDEGTREEEKTAEKKVPNINVDFIQSHNLKFRPELVQTVHHFDSIFRSQLRSKHWQLEYSILQEDTDTAKGLSFKRSTAPFVISFTEPVLYSVNYDLPAVLLIKRTSPFVLTSLLVLALAAAGFWFYYRSFRMQTEIAAFREMLFSNITHELKTPVSSLQLILEGSAKVPGGSLLTEEHRSFAAAELNRMKLLIDKVLAFSRMNRQQIDLNKELFRADEVIRRAAEAMKVFASSTGTAISVDSHCKAIVSVDGVLFVNALTALIDNAIRYNNGGQKRVCISLSCKERFAELRVADNGPGIPLVYRQKIFESFFRISKASRHEHHGSGLGLSFVAEVIKLHGGSIVVEDAEDAGACFVITIPTVYHEIPDTVS
jgi:signal transduction histidine kinase